MWASASTGRCFLIGGNGTPVRQSSGRYTDERPFMSPPKESWAWKREREGKEWRSLRAVGFADGGAQALRSATRRLLYLQCKGMGGRALMEE